MKKAFKSFFQSNTSLLVFSILAICMWVSWGLACLSEGFLYVLAADAAFYILLMGGLLISYKKGETNIQKALIGALLLLLINSNIEILWSYVAMQMPGFIILDLVTLILAIIIFIGHLIQQSDRTGKTSALILNQCSALMALILFGYWIRQAFFVEGFPVLDVTFICAWILTYLTVICIETKIQVYKQIRFEARSVGKWDDAARKEAKEIFKL